MDQTILYFLISNFYSPGEISSGATNSLRSGSSPYQKIQSSLAAWSDSGGCCNGGGGPMSNIPPPEPGGALATRRQTHNISLAMQREYERKTGSSSGSPFVPPPSMPPPPSPHTSLRHFIPHKSVCNRKKI